jgi:hypothetical protein
MLHAEISIVSYRDIIHLNGIFELHTAIQEGKFGFIPKYISLLEEGIEDQEQRKNFLSYY